MVFFECRLAIMPNCETGGDANSHRDEGAQHHYRTSRTEKPPQSIADFACHKPWFVVGLGRARNTNSRRHAISGSPTSRSYHVPKHHSKRCDKLGQNAKA